MLLLEISMGGRKDDLQPNDCCSSNVPNKLEKIKAALEVAFLPVVCDVFDESHLHSRGVETHYKVVLVSDSFVNVNRVKRHQLVYAALGDIMQQIHALSIYAYSMAEWYEGESEKSHDSPSCHGGSKHDLML